MILISKYNSALTLLCLQHQKCKFRNFNAFLSSIRIKKTVVLTQNANLMKHRLFFITLLSAVAFSAQLTAQNFPGLDKSPLDMAIYPGKDPAKVVRVLYSRPQLKGRTLSDLAPEGKIWRTGANESTEITFYQDVTFGGAAVPAGTYALFSIPGASEWTVVLNKTLHQWGAYTYDASADLVRVPAKASTATDSLDAFSMTFAEDGNGAQLIMGWDKTRVAVPISW